MSILIPTVNAGQTTYKGNPDTVHIINTPTHTEGDVIYIYASTSGNNTMDRPNGFSTIFENTASFQNRTTVSLWYKTASSNEPNTYEFSINSRDKAVAISWSTSNDGGIDVISSDVGESSTVSCPDAISTVNNTLILRLVNAGNDSLPHSIASGYTELDSVENPPTTSNSVQYNTQVAAGSVGQIFINIDLTVEWIGHTVIIKPNSPSSPIQSPKLYKEITFQRGSGSTGTSHTIDIGESGNNRLIVAVFGDESTSGDVFTGSFTVDGKTFKQAMVADNPDGVGNHLEIHTIDEAVLGSSNGPLVVTHSGGDSGSAIHVLVFYNVVNDNLVSSGKEDIVTNNLTVSVENISSNNGSLIIMASGNGSFGSSANWTAPLVERTDGPNPSSAVLSTASGIEEVGQTNKTYSVNIGIGLLRSTGIVLVFDPVPIVNKQTHQFML
jgi:hypothetical protein